LIDSCQLVTRNMRSDRCSGSKGNSLLIATGHVIRALKSAASLE